MKKLLSPLFFSLLAGCASTTTHLAPNADLSHYERVFVEHRLADGNGVDQIITRELRARGYDASSGPLTMLSDEDQIIVAYDDEWAYDFGNHMIGLDLTVRKARTDAPLAIAHYRKPSMTTQSPVVTVDILLDKLFKAKPPLPPAPPLPGPGP